MEYGYIHGGYNLITFRSRLETWNDSGIDPFNLMADIRQPINISYRNKTLELHELRCLKMIIPQWLVVVASFHS